MNTALSLRERKKARTRAAIQEQALRLFLEKGYDAATVEEIAASAGVSHMTFFRYFPTKEAVVLTDEFDPLIAAQINARPATEPVIETIRQALGRGLELVYGANRELLLARVRLILSTPALRARLWEQQHATQRLIASSLAASRTDSAGSVWNEDDLRARVVAGACLAAVTAAIETWAESSGIHELPDLIDQALTMLDHELSSPYA